MQNLLYLLPVLACPLGMAVMGGVMWVMMRAKPGTRTDAPAANQPTLPMRPDDRLAMLHAQQHDVHAQIQQLVAQDQRVALPHSLPVRASREEAERHRQGAG